ncbi:Las1-like-domain-containing protein [Immersiella caudata]|uniref:Las1-like-domain-containing protein n=1 Tax=Immersiella caudata TaxID=314043 RepID=A0AA39WEW3_9PEZI|nr:Las1-like-domain-containing protein [Immersiella caudata]
MVQYIFTPWRNRRELLAVRSALYPQKTNNTSTQSLLQKQQAVARVSMWMHRGSCPHLVESTALLTAAILSDASTSETNSYAARAAYSAAFSRFVTGLLDSHQTQARKMSMYGIAKSVGLPATFVELRHQATHETLPSLTRLREAAGKALEWIWEYYWVHLEDAEGEEDGERDVGRAKAELGMAWQEMRKADGDDTPEGRAEGGEEETSKVPPWSLHDEDTWVPKPIGMV